MTSNAGPVSEFEDNFENIEKLLREFDFYHGFLPREDLPYVLKDMGDYLVRVSEVDIDKGKFRREVILSVVPQVNTLNTKTVLSAESLQMPVNYRNIVIKMTRKKFYVEKVKIFTCIRDLIDYYCHNFGNMYKFKFKLVTPIPLAFWEFRHCDLTLGKVLGSGVYGEVRAGTMKTREGTEAECAMKIMKDHSTLTKAKVKEMMNEARFMRNLSHKNIVRTFGVAVIQQPLYILMELVKGPSLDIHLKSNRGQVTVFEKVRMCVDSARGLAYLHKNNCVHRDTAARNCLYGDDKVTKITDFGLSRAGPAYKMKAACKIPVRWIAPESLQSFVFTCSSDVFSFGVLMYEIFSEGTEPWENVTNPVVRSNVMQGNFLKMPPSCPERLSVLVASRIFVKDASLRCTMQDALAEIEEVEKSLRPEGTPAS